MRSLIEKLTAISEDRPTVGDGVYLEFGNILQVDTEIMEMNGDSITLLGDEKLFKVLESLNEIENKQLSETKLWRARDFGGNNNVVHYRDDYFIATNTHDDGDSRKVDHVLLKKMVKTDDEGTPAYQQITVLKVSPYRATRDEINQAADRVIASSSNVNEADIFGRAVTPTSRFKVSSAFTQDTERAATKYKPNKYYPETGLGGYISSHATSNDKLNRNIINQIKRNLDTAIGKPLEFINGDNLKINPVIARKALAKIENLKAPERHAAVNSIMQSKANFVRFMGESIDEGEVVSLQDNHQTLKRLAKMWWHGDEGKHAQAVKMLSNMGWDIAEDDDDIVLNKGGREIRFFMDDLYEEMVAEAEYHGRKVPLGKPMKGDVKKKKVYVKNPKTGKVIKVNFGDKKMRIKRSNPKRRKSFRARHNCKTAKDRTTARYWSCRAW